PFFIGYILARHYLETTDSKVIYDNRARLAYRDLDETYPGRTKINKAGRTNFFAAMNGKNVAVASETSGHYYFQEFFNTDSSLFTFGLILKLMESGLSLTTELQQLSDKYYLAGEVNYEVDNKDELTEIFK